jgi:hypothetical protein
MRPQFASYLRIGDRRPDLIIRFGYGLSDMAWKQQPQNITIY